MVWNIDFISYENFKQHVKETIRSYEDNLKPFDIKRFNKNIIDPIKLVFDKYIYDQDWEEIVQNEISRQRDKSNNNSIGYFHQKIFKYIECCMVPDSNWDVIVKKDTKFKIDENTCVSTIYTEIKNKHNTMNSSSIQNTYMRMQNQILHDDNCACYLVQVISDRSQDKVWNVALNKDKMSHKKIRVASMDYFYELITGDPMGFYKICIALPETIEEVLSESPELNFGQDTVFKELNIQAKQENISFLYALYLLGFNPYKGFKN